MKGKQNIFIRNLQMETQTVFTENGNINIYPCAFELGNHIVAGNAGCVRQSIIFQLRFPKRLGKSLIEALLREEQEELQAFVKTRRSETKWAL